MQHKHQIIYFFTINIFIFYKNNLKNIRTVKNNKKLMESTDPDIQNKRQKMFMDTVRPLGDEFLGKHSNEGVRKMYGLLKAAAKRN